MDRLHFDADHQAFGEAFRAFVDKSVVPDFLEFERAGITPREVFAEAGRSGFLGKPVRNCVRMALRCHEAAVGCCVRG